MSVKSEISTMYPGVQAFDFEITIPDSSKAPVAQNDKDEKLESEELASSVK
ncbi:MAG: hypothetical protein AB1631_22720 [Acidobacteriota bacterium]